MHAIRSTSGVVNHTTTGRRLQHIRCFHGIRAFKKRSAIEKREPTSLHASAILNVEYYMYPGCSERQVALYDACMHLHIISMYAEIMIQSTGYRLHVLFRTCRTYVESYSCTADASSYSRLRLGMAQPGLFGHRSHFHADIHS